MNKNRSSVGNDCGSDNESIAGDSRIFVRNFPILGDVPVGFYIPD